MTAELADWRRHTRRQIAWALLLKLAALIALWALFFSPAHRAQITPEAVQHQFAPAAPNAPVSGD